MTPIQRMRERAGLLRLTIKAAGEIIARGNSPAPLPAPPPIPVQEATSEDLQRLEIYRAAINRIANYSSTNPITATIIQIAKRAKEDAEDV